MSDTWNKSPLDFLIGNISANQFLNSYYERKPLICVHDEPERYKELLNIDRVDEIIAHTELPPESLEMARSAPSISRENYTFSNGNIDRGAVIRHFQQGATVILTQLQLADAKLASLCTALENVFSAQVQTNVYFTPPNNQGFRTHYDDHDVFVMQISGEKLWKLYDKPIDNPYRGENFQPGKHKPGKAVESFTLKAGDCVYIPRGLMHDAVSSGAEPALHITVGIIIKSWADLMLEAMSQVALNNPKYRHALPPGFAKQEFDHDTARAYFKDLVSDFKQQANFDSVFELFIQNFIRARSPQIRGSLLAASSPQNSLSRYRRRVNTQAKLLSLDNGDEIIICGGGDLHFDRYAKQGLLMALSGECFTAEAFMDVESLAKKTEAEQLTIATDCINKLIAFGIIEVL
ncbi:MAG: hypothetical protein COC19_07595 [SAR86 cluster bacterium]|uniref:JmjC domain-containing protein n=1 Tax=SAR86 cluster bacterium TaxID=2030880 RepID=A0A2A4MGW3_9GAMM|nr:MAG: hypothetical protein COC19_07595 [SAR86 cluster bacterium]